MREARLTGSWWGRADLGAGPAPAGLPEGTSLARCREDCSSAAYFDTPGLRLLRRGMTLRYRRDAPASEDRWMLELPVADAYGTQRWVTWPGGPGAVPEALARDLGPLLGGEPIEVVAELTTMRRTSELRDRSGARIGEIRDDWVSASVPAPARLRSVTALFDSGDAALLGASVGWLRPVGAGAGPGGRDLARVLGAGPVPEGGPALDGESSVAEMVAASSACALEHLVAGYVGIRFGDDAEAVHRLRVATRRFRSELRTLAAVLEPRWARHTRAELAWIAGRLGEVRDADVLSERVACDAGSVGAEPAVVGTLCAPLHAQREDAYGVLREALRSDRYVDLVRSLEGASVYPPITRGSLRASGAARPLGLSPAVPARVLLPGLLRRPWRELRRSVEHLGSEAADSELHRVRLGAKQLRYAAELAAPVLGERARRLSRAARSLQDVLGDHHDAVAAECWLLRAGAVGDPTVGLVAERCIAIERQCQAARRDEWPEVWRKLRRNELRHWTA